MRITQKLNVYLSVKSAPRLPSSLQNFELVRDTAAAVRRVDRTTGPQTDDACNNQHRLRLRAIAKRTRESTRGAKKKHTNSLSIASMVEERMKLQE